MPTINIQFPTRINAASVNGVDGFMIKGFSTRDRSTGGWSVSRAGDINGDGIADVMIGAPQTLQGGASYILFGRSEIGGTGIFDISSLNGANGFTITGFPADGFGGWSGSGIGDVNGDGVADLVIGAPYAFAMTGICYVIFGKVGIGSSGILSVASLNGSDGFAITGFQGGFAGGSVGGAGDINGDGIADLVLGSNGGAYIVFGKVGIGSSGILSVTSLDGSNGFIITGFPTHSYGVYSVKGAGDINDDGIADLVIGTAGPSGYGNMNYIVFGESDIGSSGTLSVAALTGRNGFAITGFPAAMSLVNVDYSVSGAGDINGDGIADFVIGTPYQFASSFTATGASYVVFGKKAIGSSGALNVSSLTGLDGFAITGFPIESLGGNSVSEAGDINGDGIVDLVIGASNAFGGAGLSYVLFGKSGIGGSGTLDVSSLTESNGFVVTGFAIDDSGGFAVSGAGDINDDGISDVIIGAPRTFDGIGACYVVFGERVNTLDVIKNNLLIRNGQTLVFDSRNLNVTNLKNLEKDSSLQFNLSGVRHGHFFSSSNVSVMLTSFLQQQVRSGQIQFAHDGSGWPPTYNVSISYAGMFAITSPQVSTITFQQSFLLVNNKLTINQGQTVILTSNDLSANDLYYSDNNPNLIFSIDSILHGYFALVGAPTTPIISFLQAQIQSRRVQFVHDDTINLPSYSVTVIEGASSTTPQAAIISFDAMPIFINNHLQVNQGHAVILTANDLSAINPYDAQANLSFTITQVKYGYFARIGTTTPITTFTPTQIQQGQIQFVPDGSTNPPSYEVQVSDGRMTSNPQSSTIFFNEIPVLINNHLTINQGQTVVLTATDLSAIDKETPADDLVFTTHAVEHGQFEKVGMPGIVITVFAQQLIRNGLIKFIADGSAYSPAYNMSVNDGAISSPSEKAIINFIPNPKPEPPAQSDPVRNAFIGGIVSGVVGLFFLLLKMYLERKATRSMHQALEGGKSETEKRLISYQKEVIKPIANKVFDRIKTTQFLSYRSDKDTKAYVSAIESIVGKLTDLGVDLDLSRMNATQQNKLLNEIAKQTRLQVIPDYSCCSCAYFGSFFKPEATPQQLEDSADVIAAAVQAAMRSQSSNKSEQKTAPEPAEMQEIQSVLALDG